MPSTSLRSHFPGTAQVYFAVPFDFIGGEPGPPIQIVVVVSHSPIDFSSHLWYLPGCVVTLDVYPNVKGMQVMNDMGEYMFSQYRADWMPDTRDRRRAIISRLRTWNPFSNSSPVEGIEKAIRTFYDPNKKISLYVFGDDFSGRSIARVVREVDRLNRERSPGERMVRIHAIGFPVFYMGDRATPESSLRFANLMRELAWRNGGTFVGLNNLR